jgi:hypothetical protein
MSSLQLFCKPKTIPNLRVYLKKWATIWQYMLPKGVCADNACHSAVWFRPKLVATNSVPACPVLAFVQSVWGHRHMQ